MSISKTAVEHDFGVAEIHSIYDALYPILPSNDLGGRGLGDVD
jgi:hypothetical protein